MRTAASTWCVLFMAWLGAACASRQPLMQAWEGAGDSHCEAPSEDHCVVLGCEEGLCGLFPCADVSADDVPLHSEEAPAPGATLAMRPGFPMGPARPGRWWRRSPWLRQGAEPVMTFRWYPERPPLRPPLALPAPRMQKHHIFPQAQDLAAWFTEKGINIHDYTILIPTNLHRRIHGGGPSGGMWNEAWRKFVEARRRTASHEEIFRHAGELIYRFELTGPVVPYYRQAR